jgi:lipopolysaccharide export system permease protein
MNQRFLPRGLLLSGYILRTHAGPFIFSLATLMFIFLLQFVMKFIDQLVGKGLSSWVIMELVALNLSWMLVLAVPMSVLVATLMAFGDLSSRNEITAMKASGVSTYRMMLPGFVAAILVAMLLVWFNNYVLPESNHRLKALNIDIRRKRPTLTLVPGVFSQDLQGYSILVRKTFENSNDLEGVTIYDYTNPSVNVVITAERGTISFSPDFRKLIMDLKTGEIHQLDLQKRQSYRRIRFDSHRIATEVEGFTFERTSESVFTRGDRELSAQAMRVIVDSLTLLCDGATRDLNQMMEKDFTRLSHGMIDTVAPLPGFSFQTPSGAAMNKARMMGTNVATSLFRLENLDRQVDQYLVEIYKKYSIPVACLVFVLVGAPLGIMARRGGFGIAASLSMGFFVLYWACLIGGEKLADRDILSPFFGMWSANMIIGLMGIYLTVRIARETVTINWSYFQRLIPKRWQSKMEGDDRTAELAP